MISKKNWTEINLNQSLVEKWAEFGQVKTLTEVKVGSQTLPVVGLLMGTDDKSAPTLGLFGGVHGLERVGSHVVINHLLPMLEQLKWDQTLRDLFRHFRIVSIPIVNPGGMLSGTRANPNGVDIMRNAPIDAIGNTKPLVSGHRISPQLPWYRGHGGEMEDETKALINFVKSEMFESEFSIAIDIHSGFGVRDRIWYPYSTRMDHFPYIDEIKILENKLRASHPYHVYKIEPQFESYMLHGDPWDYLFDRFMEGPAKLGKKFIPLCLEMGSWSWLRKNPRQIFSRSGIFNPILPHRYSRIMRRHRPLLDFLKTFTRHHQAWRNI